MPEDYRFRSEAIAWLDWFAFGFGGRVILVAQDLSRRIEVPLGCYFSRFAPLDQELLVASGQGIVCFRPDGALAWRNDELGLDGVIVHDIADGVVSGDGEWDPPGGWRPFRISLATGQAVP